MVLSLPCIHLSTRHQYRLKTLAGQKHPTLMWLAHLTSGRQIIYRSRAGLEHQQNPSSFPLADTFSSL